MAHDYRYNAFDDVAEPLAISGEIHIIPSSSPYTIRLAEVPQKTTPSGISLTIAGTAASEVAATPAAGEFWVDYNTGADNDENWNTGTIQFNSADAGKTVVVNYNGIGTLVSVDFHGTQLFDTAGTHNFTIPKGVSKVYVSGSGAGGGGSPGWSGQPTNGGGSGDAVYRKELTVVPGSIITVTVGAGGSAGYYNSSTNIPGGAGGASSFGSLLSLPGGGGGSQEAPGSSGGEGGFAGTSTAVGDSIVIRGGGGNTRFCAAQPILFGNGSGANGSKYGQGGGAAYSGGTSKYSGGAGAPGFILVEW